MLPTVNTTMMSLLIPFSNFRQASGLKSKIRGGSMARCVRILGHWYHTKSGRSLPDFVSSARAAPERSRFPHREAINRKAYQWLESGISPRSALACTGDYPRIAEISAPTPTIWIIQFMV
ncbi:hypothetical protein HBB12_030475 (plasmid) [Methylobacterium sp. SyP6R]|nr:hypothetical protein [Methylobacterium sp. SyP6R]MCF4129639.1 hypothetical protein [Methylobacterium sp. SyP6R]